MEIHKDGVKLSSKDSSMWFEAFTAFHVFSIFFVKVESLSIFSTGITFNQLCKVLPNIKYLHLKSLRIIDNELENVLSSTWKNIETLSFSKCSAIDVPFKTLKSLTHLDISYSVLDSSKFSVFFINNCSKIKIFKAQGLLWCHSQIEPVITSMILAQSKAPEVIYLDFRSLEITFIELEKLVLAFGFKHNYTIDLRGCEFLTGRELAALKALGGEGLEIKSDGCMLWDHDHESVLRFIQEIAGTS